MILWFDLMAHMTSKVIGDLISMNYRLEGMILSLHLSVDFLKVNMIPHRMFDTYFLNHWTLRICQNLQSTQICRKQDL